jgi:hypothetical protein
MKCNFSKEMLALHAAGDLTPDSARRAANHLASCDECRQFVGELNARLALLKTLRSETANSSDCANMRRAVMAAIDQRQNGGGSMLRLERAIVLGVCRPCVPSWLCGNTYAMAMAVAICLISVAVFAQMRHDVATSRSGVAMFEDKNMLRRPDGYRDWMLVRSRSTREHKVFVSPAAYRGYADTGRFPEGTLMIWERTIGSASNAHGPSAILLASVKDSLRFDGGWGFFDFTAADGTVAPKASALPEASACRTCHRKDT